jgi:hypothetical protein
VGPQHCYWWFYKKREGDETHTHTHTHTHTPSLLASCQMMLLLLPDSASKEDITLALTPGLQLSTRSGNSPNCPQGRCDPSTLDQNHEPKASPSLYNLPSVWYWIISNRTQRKTGSHDRRSHIRNSLAGSGRGGSVGPIGLEVCVRVTSKENYCLLPPPGNTPLLALSCLLWIRESSKLLL